MIHTSKVGPKGQVVIPKDLRDEFGIFPGANVVFEDSADAIVIKKRRVDSAKVFAEISKAPTKKAKRWQPHEVEEEIEEKLGRIGLK